MAISSYFASGRTISTLTCTLAFHSSPIRAQVEGDGSVKAITIVGVTYVGVGAGDILQILRIIIEVGVRACYDVVRPYGEGVFHGVQFQPDGAALFSRRWLLVRHCP